MKKVKLIGPGLKLNNSWHFIGDIVEITDEEYEKNCEFLKLIEEIEKSEQDNKNGEQNNENDENNNATENENDEDPSKDENENPEEDKGEDETDEDEEMELLKEKAKKLGINPGKMKKETLLKKIEAAESQKE